jgi:hypothetical protein
MGQRLTTAVVAVTTGATLILGANNDAQLRAIAASGNIFIGTAGVTTTTGFPVTTTASVFMNGGDDRHSAVFVGPLWAVATNTGSNASVMEIST